MACICIIATSVGGGIFRELINLTPTNHHFKSLGHNPTLLGLFFSILDQFTNTSDFVSNGELISLNNSEGKFELQGKNIPSKLFCGIVNWIGHLISDVSGSSSSKGRGMGLPSPIWAWSNDVIAIKRKLNIPLNEFDKSVNELALKLFEKGYDVRFQTTQTIPVFINEIVVRMLYSIRRLIKYYITVPSEDRCWGELWKSCEPFSNATVKRMLTVAHGTFCLINYGYIEGVMAPDGEEQDAYILGVNEPVKKFTGKIIAIVRRKDGIEEKWVVVPDGVTFSKEEIRRQIHFQEQYFDSEIVM